MELGFVGLGRMGLNMVRRLQRDRHRVIVWDRAAEPVKEAIQAGAIEAGGLGDPVAKLAAARAVWGMVPAGALTESTITALVGLVSEGEHHIDGRNTHFQ